MGQAFEVEHFLWFVLAFGASFLLTPLVRLGAVRLGFVDHPKERRIHTRPLPMGGGVALFIAFWITIAGSLPFSRGLVGLAVSSGLLLLVGLVDDAVELRWYWKLAGQVAAASILIAYGERIEFVTHPLSGETVYIGAWGIPLTLLWLVAMANMINFIDGLDGLAAGVCTIAAISAVSGRGVARPVGAGSDDGCDCRGVRRLSPAQLQSGSHHHGRYRRHVPRIYPRGDQRRGRAQGHATTLGVRRADPGAWACPSLTRSFRSRGGSPSGKPIYMRDAGPSSTTACSAWV